MKKLLILMFLILGLCVCFIACSNLDNENTDADAQARKSDDTNRNEQTNENEEQALQNIIVQCDCSACNVEISKGEAILIAQQHYFSTETPQVLSKHIISAQIYDAPNYITEEYWAVLIGEKCLGKCLGPEGSGNVVHDILGGGYCYIINKKNGEIVDVILQN